MIYDQGSTDSIHPDRYGNRRNTVSDERMLKGRNMNSLNIDLKNARRLWKKQKRKQTEMKIDLLASIQFRNIITFLKHGGMRTSARWLVIKAGGLSIKESREYVDGCHVCSDGFELKEKKGNNSMSGIQTTERREYIRGVRATKHTLGPWKVELIPDSGSLRRIVDDRGYYITTACHCTDAALLASAPELLEACKIMVKAVEDAGRKYPAQFHAAFSVVDIGKAAITKAEGGTA